MYSNCFFFLSVGSFMYWTSLRVADIVAIFGWCGIYSNLKMKIETRHHYKTEKLQITGPTERFYVIFFFAFSLSFSCCCFVNCCKLSFIWTSNGKRLENHSEKENSNERETEIKYFNYKSDCFYNETLGDTAPKLEWTSSLILNRRISPQIPRTTWVNWWDERE